jgi:peptide chain release factor subunit 1
MRMARAGRGGQSALRFARLRLEKRHNYVTKVAEMAAQVFISNDKLNVVGLIVAGSAEFKNVLIEAERFDQRLASKVIMVCDVSYGGENGLNQAIEQSADMLSNVKFIQEKKVIKKYFDEIAQDTGKICFGIDDTMKCLESSAVETLMVWENLEHWSRSAQSCYRRHRRSRAHARPVEGVEALPGRGEFMR